MSKAKSRSMSHSAPTAGTSSSRDKNNNTQSSIAGRSQVKKSKLKKDYDFRPRSIQNRIETDRRRNGEVKKEPKPKSKPPPLSKYRRKTANARERFRMREINTAYELLQKAVPQFPIIPQGKSCEKLTKITTLRLAMNYIQTLQGLLHQPGGGVASINPVVAGVNNYTDIESDTDSIGNSILSSPSSSSSSATAIISSGGGPGSNSGSGSGSEFSPASCYTMSPMSSCSPVGPDCIQTVMRSVVTPAAAAAISANAANLTNLNLNNVTSSHASLGIVAPHQSITTIVTIPSHPHAQAQYSRQLPPTVQHHHQQHHPQPHHHHTPSPITRSPAGTISPSTFATPSTMMTSSTILTHQQQHTHQQQQQSVNLATLPIPMTTSSSVPTVLTPLITQQKNPLLCSQPQQTTIVSHKNMSSNDHTFHVANNNSMNKMKLPPIATSLSSALLRKSMSSFLTDCVQLTNGVSVSTNNFITPNNNHINTHSNNGNRTGSLSSLTESDFSEYTNDLLSDEGSVLDEPMFEDIIGVGATELELLLGSESLGFTSDLSAI